LKKHSALSASPLRVSSTGLINWLTSKPPPWSAPC